MILYNNINLGEKTTFGIGGQCDNYFIPESIDELIRVYKENENAYLLAGGSNIVINDKKKFECVISLLSFNKDIKKLGDGSYYVGASVRNQKLIRIINDDGFGGIEDLISVPGTIGGAIYMNAGTGKETGRYISDYLVEVDFFDGKNIIKFSKDECDFSYRHSIFQEIKGVIIGALFKFKPQSLEESQIKIRERMEKVEKYQDRSGKTCGTLYKERNKNIMKLMKLISFGKKGGIHFSSKTPNWLVNSGDGNYDQFCRCIKIVSKIHRLFRKQCLLEIEVWE